ncbi:hypothetical protein J4221_03445 [Candidatus Pacearchaeota archaeon]|nr:hypothetical protein [Candidatus Pacearchaeota archaeon]
MSYIEELFERIKAPTRDGNDYICGRFVSPRPYDSENYVKEIERLNSLIKEIKLNDFKELWGFFSKHPESDEDKEKRFNLFGEEYIEETRGRILGTVTSDNKQLRVWNGLPAGFTPNHVDSCGRNLIFEAYPSISTIEKLEGIIFLRDVSGRLDYDIRIYFSRLF